MTDELEVIRNMDRARQLRSEAMHEMAGRLRDGLAHRLGQAVRAAADRVAQPVGDSRTDTLV